MTGPLLAQRALLLVLAATLALVASGCQSLGAANPTEHGAGLSAPAVDGPSLTDPATATAEPPPTATVTPFPTATPSPTTQTASTAASELSTAPVAGALAPDLTLMDLSGNEVTLSGLRGKAVLLNFWATW
jgi:hypothetical protein